MKRLLSSAFAVSLMGMAVLGYADTTPITSGLNAPAIDYTGGAAVIWGPLVSQSYLNMSGSANNNYPQKFTKTTISGNGGQAGGRNYCSGSSTPESGPGTLVPPSSVPVYEWFCNYPSPPAPQINFEDYKYLALSQGNVCGGQPCYNTAASPHISGINDPVCTVNGQPKVWFFEGSPTFSGGTYFCGVMVSKGSVSFTGSGTGVISVTPPNDAWKQYEAATPSGAAGFGDTSAADEYPGDAGLHAVKPYTISSGATFQGYIYASTGYSGGGGSVIVGAVQFGAGAASSSGGGTIFFQPTTIFSPPPPNTVNEPIITPPGGCFPGAIQVTIGDTTPGSAIHYTLDGTTPNSSSTLYTGPFSLSASATLNAIGTKTGLNDSAVATAIFTIGGACGNPPPLLSKLTPDTTTAGSPSFTMRLDGSQFLSGAKAQWNGADLATTFVSVTQLRATVPAANVVNTGIYSVLVMNPDGQTSAPLSFTVVPVQTAPIINFVATPTTITSGGSSTLSWTITNATTASIDQGVGTVSATSGNVSVSPTATTTYTITASGPGGTRQAQVTVTVNPVGGGNPPVISMFSAAPPTINAGDTSTLSWSISNATSAVINQNIGSVSTTSGNTVVIPANTTTYTLTACGNGCVTAQVTVTVNTSGGNPPVINSFTATPPAINAGSTSTLGWSISNATSAVIDQGVGPVSNTSGSFIIIPNPTTTYTLTACGNGCVTAQVTVAVNTSNGGNPPVINSFIATPPTINQGNSSTLSWDISNATSATINQNIGAVTTTTGNTAVSPANTTVYTLTACGDGCVTAQVTVTVNTSSGNNPPVINSFTATPPAINQGDNSVLSWSISNATSAVINQNIGSVSMTSGNRIVTPANTTIYILTACGNGCVTAQVTVTVNTNGGGGNNPPVISFSANPTTINLGNSSMLSWTISNATSAVIDTGIGPITVTTGSRLVSPIATRTFTLSAWGPGGSRTAQVTISVSGTGNPTGAGSTDLSNAKAYPVPYKAKQSTIGGILFNGLSTGSRIRIFSTDGHLVQTLYADDHVLWPVTNKKDEKVASGVYFYRIDNGAGQVKEGKLVIIQ